MKRITSIIVSVMTLCGALYIPLTAGAAELPTGTKPTFDPNYTAVFNDFEDTSLVGFESNKKTPDGVTAFTVVDTDDENYNHSFKIAAVTWVAMDDGNATKKDGTRATYTGVNGQTVNLFDEPLTEGNNYIMSYDYKNIAETFSGDQTVSFAPKHENFKVGTDYRDHIVYNDNQNWYKYNVGFTADVDSLKLKINTCGGVGAYIDNLLVVEAAEFKDLTDNSATIEVTEGEIVTNNKNGIANMVAKGNKLSFKVNVADSFYKAVVTHGGTVVTPFNGVYTIDKVTADIVVKTEIKKDVLDGVVKAEFPVDDSNNIKFSAGDTLAKFMDETKIVESLISLKNGENDVARDEMLRDGYVLNIVDGEGKPIVSYKVKIDGTVDNYTPVPAETAIINNYISETITKSGTGIDNTNLEKSVLYNGNRSAVANVIKKAMRGENVTIVAFGGSITQGAGSEAQPSSITHSFSGNENYVKLVGDWFKSVFGDNVAVKNAGIGATDTPYAIHRMNMDVMNFNPDLVIVEWDKNDVNKDTYKQATYENMLRKFISKGVAVVMFGMCGNNANGDDSSIEMHVPLAEKYDLPYISYRDAFGDNTNSYKSDLLTNLTRDGVHPNIVGHQLAALLLNNYFGNIYKNIASIGSYEPVMPEEPYNAEATVFGEGKVVDLDDVADGKVEGVIIKSFGSFEKNTTLYSPGAEDIRKNHERYAYIAEYSTSYSPLVIEIDNCYSLHLLLLRVNRTDGTFKVFVNDNEVTDPKGSFTSGTASDNTQIEHTYAWASSRVCLNNEPTKITLKILPTNEDPESYVGLYGLLLADDPAINSTITVDSGEERDLLNHATSNNYPIWSQNKDTINNETVVYQEPVLFYTDNGEVRSNVKLMYPVKNIVAVTSYTTIGGAFKWYREGTDFTVNNDGTISLTAESSIPHNIKLDEIKTGINNDFWGSAATWNTELPKNQVLVTYTYTKTWDDVDYEMPTYVNNLTTAYDKLKGKDTLDVLFIGDSITTGCNASGQDGKFYTYTANGVGGTGEIKGWSRYLGISSKPYWVNDSWDKQVVANLKSAYPDATINWVNRAVGSSNSQWYYDNIEKLLGSSGSLGAVDLENTDLVFIGFGMNEPGQSKEEHNRKIKNLIDYLREKNPNVSIVLVSAFYPTFWNSNKSTWETRNLDVYEDGYFELAEQYENIAVAPVNTAFANILKAKEGVDYIANGINHPNDYGVNLYADVITATLKNGATDDTCSHKNTKLHSAVPSTCKVQGHGAYTICEDCGEVISGSDAKLPLADHNYTENVDAEYLKSAANCGNVAVYYKSCSVCGAKSTETFESGDVDSGNHVGGTYKKNEKPATCLEKGYTGDTYCRTCDNLKTRGAEIPMTDHNPANAWSSNETSHWKDCQTDGCTHKSNEGLHNGGEATCTNKSVCSVCGVQYGEVDDSNHKHTEVRDAKKATEQEKGYTGDTWCLDCNKKIAEGKDIEKLEHKPVLVKAEEATAAEEGNIEYYYCENCGKYYSDKAGTKEIAEKDTVVSKLAPKIIDGNNAKIDKSSKEPVSFRSDASFDDFVRVELDGKELVKDKDYTLKEGSIIVTLTPEFLATLPAGDHTLSIVSVSGTANADFSVTAEKADDTSSNKDSSEKSPQTRCDINAILWSLAGIISLTLISVFGIFKKRLCKSR